MAAPTWIELKKHVDTEPAVSGVVETLYAEEKFFQYIPWRRIKGDTFRYRTRTTLPGVAFRKINEGFVNTPGVVQRHLESLHPFGGDSPVDINEIRAHGNAWRAQEDMGYMLAMAEKFIQTFCYGNSPSGRAGAAFTDVDGFDGIQARVTSTQTVDGGASSGTDGSSVFAIRFGDRYCQGLEMGGLSIRDLGEQGLTDGPVMLTRIDNTAGMAIFHGRSVAWGKNFSAATTTLTCLKMEEIRSKIIGRPTLYLMSDRSLLQLKQDALSNGYAVPTGFDRIGDPIDYWGPTPIITSEAIIDTETNG